MLGVWLKRAFWVGGILVAVIALEVLLLERPGQKPLPAHVGREESSPSGARVEDGSSRLLWLRCVEGMAWDSKKRRCTGAALTVDHATAAQACGARGSGWRLPTTEEQLGRVECNPLDLAFCVSKAHLSRERARRCARAARRRALVFWSADPAPRACIHPRTLAQAQCASAVRLFRSDCPLFDGERTLLLVSRRALFRCVRGPD